MTKQTILVDGHPVTVERRGAVDYISLTDIARSHNEKPANLIANWLKSKSTLRFLETWEELFNPDFNLLQMQDIKIESIDNRSVISPQRFIERITNLVDETRNWLDTIPGQKGDRNRLEEPKK